MAEVVQNGAAGEVTTFPSGNPIVDPNISGAEAQQIPGAVTFTNATNPLETDQVGVGTPVQDEDGTGTKAQTTSAVPTFTNDTNPLETTTGGVGTPVNDVPGSGSDANLVPGAAQFTHATSPTEIDQGSVGVGLPVGGGNRDAVAVGADNTGKSVTTAFDPVAPVGTVLYKEVVTRAGGIINIVDGVRTVVR